MGTPLGLKYVPYTYMDPLGKVSSSKLGGAKTGIGAVTAISVMTSGQCFQTAGRILQAYFEGLGV